MTLEELQTALDRAKVVIQNLDNVGPIALGVKNIHDPQLLAKVYQELADAKTDAKKNYEDIQSQISKLTAPIPLLNPEPTLKIIENNQIIGPSLVPQITPQEAPIMPGQTNPFPTRLIIIGAVTGLLIYAATRRKRK